MKKNIGTKLALYPAPLVIVGAMVNGKANWTLVGHLGIIGQDRVMVSMNYVHYSNQGIKVLKALLYLQNGRYLCGGNCAGS